MFGERLSRYSGLIKLITILITFIIFVVAGSAYLDTNLVQRETFARVKTLNYLDLMDRYGADDQKIRDEIHEHVLMYRDGGRLATPYGPAWDYPAVQTQSFIDLINDVDTAYKIGTPKEFRESYVVFDRGYAEQVLGRQRLLVYLRYASAGIMFFGFLGVLGMLFFRLGRADDEALSVRRENEHILASTNEGVFLVNKDYEIGDQKSNALNKLFGQNIDVSGNFIEFIKGFVSTEDLNRTTKFLGLVFGGRVKTKLMGDLNPLHNVEITVERKIGGSVRRVLNFDFSRDEQSDVVDNLLVTVSDITKEELLKEELETIQKTQDERLSLIKGLLHVDPSLLRGFFDKANTSYKQINELLEQGSVNPDDNVEKLEEISRVTHRLKGDAAALKLELFESSLHRFEDIIDGLKKQNTLDGQSLVKLVVQLKNMIAESELAVSLTSQFGVQASQNDGDEAVIEKDGSLASEIFTHKLSTLASQVSEREGKEVNFSVSGAQHLNELPEISDGLYDIAVQLVRNAVFHGIESPDTRVMLDKPVYGKIHISLEKRAKGLNMTVEDDGQGLQFDKIKAKALETGLINAEEAMLADNNSLLKFLFQHGFSSNNDVTEDAGRGVGLDTVKKMVSELHGRVSVGSTQNEKTQFAVSVPTPKLV